MPAPGNEPQPLSPSDPHIRIATAEYGPSNRAHPGPYHSSVRRGLVLGMCAPAPFAHGQQMNIGSSFPSYLKRLGVMPSHKFRIGDSVMLKPAISRNVPGGVYEVIKQLPHNGREYEYRIKSANEEHERIAGERELTKA